MPRSEAFQSIATRRKFGAKSLSRSCLFAVSSVGMFETPHIAAGLRHALHKPSGDGITPIPRGQIPIAPAAPPLHHCPRFRALALFGRRAAKATAGTADACRTASAAENPVTTVTSILLSTSSWASCGKRSSFPSAPRRSKTRLRPRTLPNLSTPRMSGAIKGLASDGGAKALNKSMRQLFGCEISNGKNDLTASEMPHWLGKVDVPQPCVGK